MQARFTLRCIQSGEKCSFISLLAPHLFNKYKFLIKLSSSVKVILFNYITTVVCQGAWLLWKPCTCSWYSTRTKLFELNQSVAILMNLWRYALGCSFFETQCINIEDWRSHRTSNVVWVAVGHARFVLLQTSTMLKIRCWAKTITQITSLCYCWRRTIWTYIVTFLLILSLMMLFFVNYNIPLHHQVRVTDEHFWHSLFAESWAKSIPQI